nr:tetratricopeptide repeat protein [Nitrospiraceae bacterium]
LAFAGRAFAASACLEARAAYSRADYRKTIKLLSGYVKKAPSAEAYYLLGYSSYKLGRYRQARSYFGMAYRINPKFRFRPEGLICPAGKKTCPSAGKKPAGRSRAVAGTVTAWNVR